MSPTIDPFWLSGVLASVNATLMTALFAVGFFAAVRRWSDHGRSARLAGAGFGIGLLGDLGELALTVVNAGFSSKASAAECAPYLWPMFVATSLRSFARPVAMLLILLGLWFAWRDAGRWADRGPVR